MASPFMNMLSYWFFFTGQCCNVLFLVCANRSCQRWMDAYPPLSALGRGISRVLKSEWISGLSVWQCSLYRHLLGGLNYIATILNMRTKGMSMTRLPLTMWALFFTAILGVLIIPCITFRFYSFVIRPKPRNKFLPE